MKIIKDVWKCNICEQEFLTKYNAQARAKCPSCKTVKCCYVGTREVNS